MSHPGALLFCFYFPCLRRHSQKNVVTVDVRDFIAMLFCMIFMDSGLTFSSLIYFEFIFVYGVIKWSSFILLHVADQFSEHHLLKRLSFSYCILFPPLSKINLPYNCGFISGFSVLFLWYMCLFLASTTLSWSLVFQYNLMSGIVILPALLPFFKVVLAIWCLLWFHTNFRIACFPSWKNAVFILIQIVLNV